MNKIWNIPQSDLKRLYGGPLIDHEMKLLVTYENSLKKKRISKFFDKVDIRIITVIGAIFRWKTEILEFFKRIRSLV